MRTNGHPGRQPPAGPKDASANAATPTRTAPRQSATPAMQHPLPANPSRSRAAEAANEIKTYAPFHCLLDRLTNVFIASRGLRSSRESIGTHLFLAMLRRRQSQRTQKSQIGRRYLDYKLTKHLIPQSQTVRDLPMDNLLFLTKTCPLVPAIKEGTVSLRIPALAHLHRLLCNPQRYPSLQYLPRTRARPHLTRVKECVRQTPQRGTHT
jgi:hypothetical protein